MGGALAAILGLISGALGASPAGIVALILSGLGLGLGWNWLIKGVNTRLDQMDMENAGADAGKTSVDLSNQAHDVRIGLDALEAAHPPKDTLH